MKTKLNVGNIKVLVATLCAAALPLFTIAVSTTHAEDKTVGEKIDDTVITAKVKKELMTDSQYKYGDVNVHTSLGTVELSGFANSSGAKSHAADVARKVEGVKEVKNSITVKE